MELSERVDRSRLLHAPVGTGIEILRHSPDTVYRQLVREERAAVFAVDRDEQVPGVGSPARVGRGTSRKGSASPWASYRHFVRAGDEAFFPRSPEPPGDIELSTSLTAMQLDRRLTEIARHARWYEDEKGVSVLYLAMGMLRWYPGATTSDERLAPLILVPVTIQKAHPSEPFRIRLADDELVANDLLEHRLVTDFGIRLPDLPHVEALRPSRYLAAVADAIAAEPRWSVLGHVMVLGTFPSSEWLMFRDLDPARWSNGHDLAERPLLQALLCRGFQPRAETMEASDLGSLLRRVDPFHVVESDTSQDLAMLDVLSGEDLVVQGAPGTGKSQTITNLASWAVKDGKRVLVIAEKRAALTAVRQRLEEAGLGPACLEIHSDRARKRLVYAELARAAEARVREPGDADEGPAQGTLVSGLNAYSRAVHTPIGASGFTPYMVAGELNRVDVRDARLPTHALPDAASWTRQGFQSRSEDLRRLVRHLSVMGVPAEHPWRGVGIPHPPPDTARWIADRAGQLAGRVYEHRRDVEALADALDLPGECWGDVDHLLAVAEGRLDASGRDAAAVPGPVQGEGRQAFEKLASSVHDQGLLIRQDILHLFQDLHLDLDQAFEGVEDVPLWTIERRFSAWFSSADALPEWIGYRMEADALRDQGLGELVDALASGRLAVTRAEDCFRKSYFEALMSQALEERPELASFRAEGQGRALGELQRAERDRIRRNRRDIAAAHRWRVHEGIRTSPQIGLLWREIRTRRDRLPLRRLIDEAGGAIQSLKPVFLMSPASVPQYLAPGGVDFDLVLIDDAARLRPAVVLGAMARGRQAVLLGDPNQLSPAWFPDATPGTGHASDHAEARPQPGELASALQLCLAQGMRTRTLAWHHRSRHQSLFALSNNELYDNRIVLLPASGHDPELGMHSVLVDGAWDPETGVNAAEAQAVVEAVMRHARARPDLSLGVGTFTPEQQRAVLDELEARRRHEPGLEEFFSTGRYEPFFVKSVDSIQGDERDVIYISVGYGKDADGVMPAHLGDIDREGGERRVNVLATRARRTCRVFASITGSQIELTGRWNRGRAVLKKFLEYAQRGPSSLPRRALSSQRPRLVDEIAWALRGRGYDVEDGLSLGGRVDLAVRDPGGSGAFVLAILCDDSVQPTATPVRERGVLLPAALAERGWTVHHTWSMEWVHRPDEELKKIVAAIEGGRSEPS
jgi:hypothetical protein